MCCFPQVKTLAFAPAFTVASTTQKECPLDMTDTSPVLLMVVFPQPQSTTPTTITFNDIEDGSSEFTFSEWKAPIEVLEVRVSIEEDEDEDAVSVDIDLATKTAPDGPTDVVDGLEIDKVTQGPTVSFTITNPVVFEQGVAINVRMIRNSTGRPRGVVYEIIACLKTGETFDGSYFIVVFQCQD